VIPARKRWGQHFLIRGEIAEKIVEAARLRPEDTVVEIGPGEGALTRPIRRRVQRLLAIEIDPRRAEALAEEFADRSGVRVLTGDVLERTFGEWLAQAGFSPPAVLVANLPYNVATPILLAAIEEPRAIERAVVTVQREVARRLVAKPGTKDYGYLTVRVATAARARVLFDLAPGAFRPRPKVVSSVVELERREDPLAPGLRDRVLRVASLAFRSRRKTLANALAPMGGRTRWEAALAQRGLDTRVRGEELSLEDFIAMAQVGPPSP
jgi:16S rRNA (adenine1518-N6/adenine1519-N6)-dimethyltransferase